MKLETCRVPMKRKILRPQEYKKIRSNEKGDKKDNERAAENASGSLSRSKKRASTKEKR